MLTSLSKKGCYILILYADSCMNLQIGKLGKQRFNAGYYFYIGKAMGRLHSRLNRYIYPENIKSHWHIDYLILNFQLRKILVFQTETDIECQIAYEFRKLSDYSEVMKGFGSSDCKCNSHLFYKEINFELNKNIDKSIIENLGFYFHNELQIQNKLAGLVAGAHYPDIYLEIFNND